MTLPSNTPDILRNAGLKVKEHSGWRTRGHGAFSNVGVLTHHTATGPYTSNTTVFNLLIRGRSDLAGPLCNLGLDREGVVHIIAAGKAYHAGAAKASGTMAANSSGNNVYIGIEAFNSGIGEKWNKKQYDSYVLLCAALSLKVTGNSAETVRAHKETSVTGKIDPFGPTPYEGTFDMSKFRARVKAKMNALTAPAPKPLPEVGTHTRWTTQATDVLKTVNGPVVREIPEGYRFTVIDGSGSPGSPYIKTTSGNWVNGNHTTRTKPGAAYLSVMTWNVENKGDEVADVAEIKEIVAAEKPDVVCLQEGYRLYLGAIPGYKEVYHATKGYPAGSENSAQAIIVRDGVSVKSKGAIAMALEWVGPKLGIKHDPRVHRYVTVNKDGRNWRVSTWHVPFGILPVEETRKAAVNWLKNMGLLGPAIAVGDWNSLANDLQAKVGTPAGAKVDGGGLDKAVFKNCTKVSGKNLGNRGRSDHPVKIWTFKK